MITENLSTLKMHKLTQAQYDRELAAGRIDGNAWYLTPDVGMYTLSTATLMSANWESLSQTVSVNNIAEDSTVIITPAPANHTSYCDAGVYCSAQGDGTLTFTCSNTPEINLAVNVLILN